MFTMNNLSTRRAVYPASLMAALAAALTLAACAEPGNSAAAHPVLYPNAQYSAMGVAAAQGAIANCMQSASAQGLSPGNNAVAREAGRGAATLGAMSAVGALVTGRNIDGALGAGVRGAAVGAAGGAVSGAYAPQYNNVYRRYVDVCLSNQGLQVIGWQ